VLTQTSFAARTISRSRTVQSRLARVPSNPPNCFCSDANGLCLTAPACNREKRGGPGRSGSKYGRPACGGRRALRRFAIKDERRSRSLASSNHRVITSMVMAGAVLALFLDVSDLTAGRHLAVASNHTATAEGGEAEKSDETHAVLFAWSRSEGEGTCEHRRSPTTDQQPAYRHHRAIAYPSSYVFASGVAHKKSTDRRK
jgi:hypothetical protein